VAAAAKAGAAAAALARCPRLCYGGCMLGLRWGKKKKLEFRRRERGERLCPCGLRSGGAIIIWLSRAAVWLSPGSKRPLPPCKARARPPRFPTIPPHSQPLHFFRSAVGAESPRSAPLPKPSTLGRGRPTKVCAPHQTTGTGWVRRLVPPRSVWGGGKVAGPGGARLGVCHPRAAPKQKKGKRKCVAKVSAWPQPCQSPPT
jgi:hypothetical protein